jgi:uncharacterized protein YkwD
LRDASLDTGRTMVAFHHSRQYRSRRLRDTCAHLRRPEFGRLLVAQIRRSEGEARSRAARRVAFAAVVCALAAVLVPSTASTRTPTPAPEPVRSAHLVSLEGLAREVVHLVNLERTQRKLPPLRVNIRLVADARLQAAQIASTGVLEHVILSAPYPTPRTRAAAAGYAWDVLGENLALGFTDAPSAVAAWMRSPGHRANILADSYRETGVVLAPDAHGRLIFVQTFGAQD